MMTHLILASALMQVRPAIPSLLGTCSMGESWAVNGHTTWCTVGWWTDTYAFDTWEGRYVMKSQRMFKSVVSLIVFRAYYQCTSLTQQTCSCGLIGVDQNHDIFSVVCFMLCSACNDAASRSGTWASACAQCNSPTHTHHCLCTWQSAVSTQFSARQYVYVLCLPEISCKA